MISTPDRVKAIELIDEAVQSGARRTRACEEMGISDRTYRRWTDDKQVRADARPTAVHTTPSNKLSAEERQRIVDTCHDPEYANLPPGQIVAILADKGVFLGSESSFYRILHENDQQHHRGRSRAAQPRRQPTSHCATNPNQVWSWDVSYLPSPIRGKYYYLYAIMDIFSRKITGWQVHDCELGDYAAALVHTAVANEIGTITDQPLVLHADNGAIQKGSTLRAKLECLGVATSFSRPRVSNDNPYSESLFRTCKYCPSYPTEGFASLQAAREWMTKFVHWYNTKHRHSGIKHVTPEQRHTGADVVILERRKALYESAKARNPNRWSGNIRNWDRIDKVWLNPERSDNDSTQTTKHAA